MIETSHLAKPKDGPAPRWFHIAVAASMVISALAALIGTVHTGRTMSALVEQNAKLVRAGSTPILEFGHGNALDDGTSSLEFTVRNVGSGLARIVWFELRVDGKPMQSMSAAISTLNPQPVSGITFNSSQIARRTLAAGSEVRILGWRKPPPENTALMSAWSRLDQARFDRVTVQACFCSVFAECWTSTLNGDVPAAIPECSTAGRISLAG
jgi:hypothetical protein